MGEAQSRTYLAIDYGERRIGLAKSDPLGVIASALDTLEVKTLKEAVQKVAEVIEQVQPAGVVVGYPYFLSGDRSPKCDEVDKFIEVLKEEYSGEIHKVDEYASSKEAEKIVHAHGKKAGKDKKRLDRLAAVVILQRFLEDLPARNT